MELKAREDSATLKDSGTLAPIWAQTGSRWLQIVGLPLHLWTADVLQKLVQPFGELDVVESATSKVRWHPYIINPSAPKEGIAKKASYIQRFGAQYETQYEKNVARTVEVFRKHGMEYNSSGLTGNTLDSHRLISFAGHQGLDKQNAIVEELFLGYFTEGKYIGDREYLLEAAKKVGVNGAAEFLADPNNGVEEINGKQEINGAQPPEVFLSAFQEAMKDSDQDIY